ncbi:MAG TPA: hypothetical protein VFA70_11380 [Dehalococcoidia bacterium]|jgi:hypothetical protein|nr:hypothetical protein [Dehalococcoidia bacterium]
MNRNDEHDALDALFARLEQVEPPEDFVARVMARAQQGRVARWAPWQRAAFGMVYLAAFVGLGVLAYLTGSALEHSHARELITIALQDLAAVKQAPGIYLTAIAEAMPWPHLLALALDLIVLLVATRLLLKSAPAAVGDAAA